MLLDIDCLVCAVWVIDFDNLPCVRFLKKILNSSCEKSIVIIWNTHIIFFNQLRFQLDFN